MGLACDATSKLWSKTRWAEDHKDLQYTSLLCVLQAICLYLLAASIRVTDIWFFLLMPSFGESFMKSVFFTNVNFCYSINVRGMTFSISNILTLAVQWTQQYIIEEVQVNQNFNAYLYSQIALATLVLLLLPIPFQRIFGVGPSCFHNLDQIRIDEKLATSIDEDKPRRVSEAIDYHRVTTADKFVSRRETALQFRQSVMATLPKTSVFKRSTRIGATTLKP